MKVAWTILLITAFTDFIIAMGTGLLVGNAATGSTYPTGPTLLYSAIGAVVMASRTIQQALRTSASDAAELKGDIVVRSPITRTITTSPKPAKAANIAALAGPVAVPTASSGLAAAGEALGDAGRSLEAAAAGKPATDG